MYNFFLCWSRVPIIVAMELLVVAIRCSVPVHYPVMIVSNWEVVWRVPLLLLEGASLWAVVATCLPWMPIIHHWTCLYLMRNLQRHHAPLLHTPLFQVPHPHCPASSTHPLCTTSRWICWRMETSCLLLHPSLPDPPVVIASILLCHH